MPIYEYKCRSCHCKTTAFVLSQDRASDVRCRQCGSGDLEKLWSCFASPKSEESRLESLTEPSALSGLDENDPVSIGKFMKRMGQEIGEDFGGDGGDMEQAVEEEMTGVTGTGLSSRNRRSLL